MTDDAVPPTPTTKRTFLDAANAMTVSSVVVALLSGVLAERQQLGWAFTLLIVAGLLDLFDGVVARRLHRNEQQKSFGKNLDSLADLCAFGVAPAILLVNCGLETIGDRLLLIAYTVAVLWRLARFDTLGLEESDTRSYFRGLPSTYAALIFPLVALVLLIDGFAFLMAARFSVLATLLLMLSLWKIPKPKGVAYAFFLILAIVVCVVLIEFNQQLEQSVKQLSGARTSETTERGEPV